MKYFVIINLLLVAAIYGCRDRKPVLTLASIPGTYIRYAQHEFGSEYDTVTLTQQNSSANQYQITRRWKYERTGEAPEYTKTVTSGIYDARNSVLHDTETGDVITFGQKIIFIGTTKYEKL